VKGEAAALSVRAQRCQSHYFSTTPHISILSSFSKVLEKVMYNQLQEHLNKCGILTEEQFGFRSDSATNKAIYKLINETPECLKW